MASNVFLPDANPRDADADSGSVESFGSDQSQDDHNDLEGAEFEGPEKNLEVYFKQTGSAAGSMRDVSREQWDGILGAAKCEIVSHMSGSGLDAYVLSESSLFVYPKRVVIKTCGTTTLLRCLPLLKKASQELGLGVEWLTYSRKNYSFPRAQIAPHRSFEEEVSYANQLFAGSAYILGPVTSDHWYVYTADYCERPLRRTTDVTWNVMMFDMHPSAALLFFKSNCPTLDASKDARTPTEWLTDTSGIGDLVPGSTIDGFLFDPCGYSINGITACDSYYTIHVTPEESCSYASFETNLPMNLASYDALLAKVLAIFKPRRFLMTMFADDAGLCLDGAPVNGVFDKAVVGLKDLPSYKQTTHGITKIECDQHVEMANFVQVHSVSPSCAADGSLFTQ